MRTRFLCIGITLLLMLSGWGSALAATLCPHMALDQSCCHAMAGHDMASHEGMGEMPMSAANKEAKTLGRPAESCGHCMGRSNLPTIPVMYAGVRDQSKRDDSLATPQVSSFRAPLTALFTPPVLSRQGAPPGDPCPRHVLVNVFRI